MNIREDLISVNEYSRGGKKLFPLIAVVMHWTANPGLSAAGNKLFYEDRKLGKDGYGSAHYIIDDKEIVRCIPENEVAYHCGTSQLDPVSGKVYTDYARKKFGTFAIDAIHNSPNNASIGIEMCPIDGEGHFSDAVWNSAKELTADILGRNNLTADDISYHSQIVGIGFKKCPLLFVNHPEEFTRFVEEVRSLMA